jgi:hypothetical protein
LFENISLGVCTFDLITQYFFPSRTRWEPWEFGADCNQHKTHCVGSEWRAGSTHKTHCMFTSCLTFLCSCFVLAIFIPSPFWSWILYFHLSGWFRPTCWRHRLSA